MFERYHRELQNFLARKLQDHDTAAELTQESYVRVLTLQQAGEVIADHRALLYRVARNLLIDRVRQERSRDTGSIDTLDEEDSPAAPAHMQPEAEFAALEYAQAMTQAIEALPSRCREAFLLNRFDGLSHQETADRMGISRNMVAQHITRALLACKASDDRYHGRDGASRAGGQS